MKTKTLLILTCASLLSISASAQFEGIIDTAFGKNGKAIFDYGGNLTNDAVFATTIDKVNNIYYGVGSTQGGNDVNGLIIAYDPATGLPVKTFGGNGYTGFDPQIGANDYLFAVTTQANGKIVTAGYTIGATIDIIIARFNMDGSLDPTFNSNGFIVYDEDNGNDAIYSLAIQNDGKIIGAGVVETISGLQSFVVRMNTDGSPDGTFGTNGTVYLDLATGNEFFRTITVLSNGNIMLAGEADDNYSLVMLTPDGALATTFSLDGKTTGKIDNKKSSIVKVLETPDNKLLVVGGNYDVNDNYEAFVQKLSLNGNGLLSFGASNSTYLSTLDSTVDADTSFIVTDAELMADGKIMIVGGFEDGMNAQDAGILILNADGTPDATFGNNGLRRYVPGNAKAVYFTLIDLLSDGNVLLSFQNNTASNDVIIQKLLKQEDKSSVANISNINGLVVYPNPAEEMLYIDITSTETTTARLTIMDITGKVFTTTDVNLTQGDNNVYLTQEISSLQPGYYFIQVSTTKGSETIKLIKQ